MNRIHLVCKGVNFLLMFAVFILGVLGIKNGFRITGILLAGIALLATYGLQSGWGWVRNIVSLVWFLMPLLMLSYLFSIFDGGSLPGLGTTERLAIFVVGAVAQIYMGWWTIKEDLNNPE